MDAVDGDAVLSSSQPISGWSPTPSPTRLRSASPVARRPLSATAATSDLASGSGKEEHMRKMVQIIQDALTEPPSPLHSSPGRKHLLAASVAEDRHNPLLATAPDEPKAKKPRLAKNPFAGPSPAVKGTAPPTPGFKLTVMHMVGLSTEQQGILQLAMGGESIFFTGSAGTGKSVLLRQIIHCLKRKFGNVAKDAVAVTASTGIAACNIGGVTLHSFAGVGLGTGAVEDLIKSVRRNPKGVEKWKGTKVLIIDEISMVDGALFDKLVKVARVVRKMPNGFGGIQLILSGDFFQLPPVAKDGKSMVFAFESTMWDEVIDHTFKLTKVFRQKDQTFVDMLNEMRSGELSPATVRRFKKLERDVHWDDGVEPTQLFPRRFEVEQANEQHLQQLHGEAITYLASDSGSIQDEGTREKLLNNFLAQKELKLKLDAQVMLIKNIDEALVNGSMGKVVAFRTLDEHYAVNYGVPLTSQVERTGARHNTSFPIVRFHVFDAQRKRTVPRDYLAVRETWKQEGPKGEILVSRTQIPLILSWAISIHKSQGQTLERVKVDLRHAFEKGQAYVALSRATNLAGLVVLNFDPGKVIAHPRVIAWWATLETTVQKA